MDELTLGLQVQCTVSLCILFKICSFAALILKLANARAWLRVTMTRHSSTENCQSHLTNSLITDGMLTGTGSSQPMDVHVHEAAEALKPGTATRASPAVTRRADGPSQKRSSHTTPDGRGKSPSQATAAIISGGDVKAASPMATEAATQADATAATVAAVVEAAKPGPAGAKGQEAKAAGTGADGTPSPASRTDRQMNGHQTGGHADQDSPAEDQQLQNGHAEADAPLEAEPEVSDQQSNDGSDSQVCNGRPAWQLCMCYGLACRTLHLHGNCTEHCFYMGASFQKRHNLQVQTSQQDILSGMDHDMMWPSTGA